MPRHRSSLVEDSLAILARIPWWLGLVLAVASWLFLHHQASQPMVVATQPGQLAWTVMQSAWRSAAGVFQYLVPLLCLVGAGLSALRRHQRNHLLAGVAGSRDTRPLDGMSWQTFEILVAEAFRLQGWQVKETGGGGPDGGVDLVLERGHERFLVQCKQWRALKVGVEVVRELYGVMAARGATGGFVVTSGHFTDDAVAFAQGRNVRLIDGPHLHRWIRAAQERTAGHSSGQPQAFTPSKHPRPQVQDTTTTSPVCPLCNEPMVRRKAKRGGRTGHAFWGCTGYPACRGTRAMR